MLLSSKTNEEGVNHDFFLKKKSTITMFKFKLYKAHIHVYELKFDYRKWASNHLLYFTCLWFNNVLYWYINYFEGSERWNNVNIQRIELHIILSYHLSRVLSKEKMMTKHYNMPIKNTIEPAYLDQVGIVEICLEFEAHNLDIKCTGIIWCVLCIIFFWLMESILLLILAGLLLFI